jgi:hypothetical protein
MKNAFMLKLWSVIVILIIALPYAYAQDSLKKAVAQKPAVTKAKPGGIPINPKTGRPYSRYGYGSYAKTYKSQVQADSLKKVTPPLKAATTSVKPTAVVKTDTAVVVAAAKVDKSLNGQYQYLLTKVYNYQRPFVDAFWKNSNDTLKAVRTQLKASTDKVAEQTRTIASLQTDVTSKEDLLARTDTISFIGMPLAKSTYNMIMWGLVIVVGAIAAIVIARSGGAHKEATYRTNLYNELEEEYKTFKAKANEKEKKLARELQTERNKVDELMGRA